MDLLSGFWSWISSFIAQYGVLAVALIVFIKSAGIPLPVPGDLLLVLVGVWVAQGVANFWPSLFALSLAIGSGALALYLFCRWAGRDDIYRYGRYIGLTQSRVERAEQELRQRDTWAIFVARVVPGLRLAVVVACGLYAIPRRVFVLPVGLAALVYVGACMLLGYIFGPLVYDLLEQIALPAGLLLAIVGLAVVVVWITRARRELTEPVAGQLDRATRIRAGCLAGAVALLGSILVLDVLLYLDSPLAKGALTPLVEGPGIGRMSSGPANLTEPAYVLCAVSLMVAIGLGWGAVYGMVVERMPWSTLPDWIRGLVFSVLPFGASAVLVAAPLSLREPDPYVAWLTAGSFALIRSLAYGILLGLSFPIFGSRQRRGSAVAGLQSTDRAAASSE
jgi:membrane protein DedA with SNARE-associated domain